MNALALALLPFASPAARAYWSEELCSAARHTTDASDAVPAVLHAPYPPRSVWDAPGSSRDALKMSLPPTAAEDYVIPGRARYTWVWASLAFASVLGLGGLWQVSQSESSQSAAPLLQPAAPGSNVVKFEVEVRVEPGTAAVFLDGAQVAVGAYTARLPRDGTQHTLRVVADGFVTQETTFVDQSPLSPITLLPIVEPSLEQIAVAVTNADAVSIVKSTVTRAHGPASPQLKAAAAPPPPAFVPPSDPPPPPPQRPQIRIVEQRAPHVRVID